MVRLTYVVEPSAPAPSEVQPVNLAFAAAAAARASWASKEREDILWDFEQLDDGAPAGAALGDGGFDGSIFVRGTDTGAGQPAAIMRISGTELSINGGRLTGGSASNQDAPGIHDIPRNSVLFRTHAAEQTMTSSLPPAEPNAPTAVEVAVVMEERKSRGLLQLPEDLSLPDGTQLPQRSASFSPGIDQHTNNGVCSIANTASGSSSAATNVLPNSRKASYNHPYVVGAGTAGSAAAALGALSSSGGMPGSLAGPAGEGEGEGEGDGEGGERDGCLVLPVLRTLLAMQQDESPRPPSLRLANQSHSLLQGLSTHGGYGSGGHSLGGGHVHGGGSGGSSSNNYSRQASVHVLRASVTSAFMGGGGGGGVARQGSSLPSGPPVPARRRVVVGGGGAAAPMDSMMAMGKASAAPPRRQASSLRTAQTQHSGHHSAVSPPPPLPPPPDDDDSPLGIGTFESAARRGSYNTSAVLGSPGHSFTQPPQQTANRHQAAARGLANGGPSTTAVAGGSGDTNNHGGRGASPPPVTRHGGGGIAAAATSAAARGSPGKAAAAQQQQQQQTQPQPQQPAAPATSKSSRAGGKALFAWTHKLGKGRWSWFPGGGGTAAASRASAAATTAASNAVSAPGPVGAGGVVGGQELPPSVHGSATTDGVGVGGVRPAAALSLSSSTSGNGRTSATGRSSGNGQQAHSGPPPASQASPTPPPVQQHHQQQQGTAGLYIVPRDLVQLPPIESSYPRRKSTAASEPLSPTGLRAGGGAVGGPLSPRRGQRGPL
ncbi:hypothetical protein VOLCADRAFT_98118 [Volvox carteri f. nagariensis]|uniref:Uncharacterized protein n=1 Tax=Volvox carteri f. nagariensis TaxID=3068 RepID=D8UEH6_VOLCA|nr:uncharacterized protein VOLCADRAFT_98118 [Volvox carteri f. nagariensis]EFJ41846.1 hypothetical protein VOLCADRAFT_98118 [Volvox carteri f. nagariensis]|eukprot:XP_002957044.1 hypothetical protein VOLCADRAFT_98118 [Volvox carteri f. nagariensis]